MHLKYVIEVEQFLKVTSCDNNLDRILSGVEYALPETSRFVGVFETELEAYVYTREMYKQIVLNDVVP